MKHRFYQLFVLLVCICAMSHPVDAQAQQPGKPKEFIYLLRLVPRLYDDKNWTKEDNGVLERHFARFQEAIKSGQLILAGRTKSRVTRHLVLRFSGRLMKRPRERSWKPIPPSRPD